MRNWRKSLKMDKSRKSIFFAVTLLFIAAAIMGLCLGVVPLTPSQLIKAIREGAGSSFEGNIFWYARLPRTAACLLSGAGLAVAGAVIQGVLAN